VRNKQYLSTFLVTILTVISSCCAAGVKKPAATASRHQAGKQAYQKSITGLVEKGANGFVITTNWTCKCRTSYTVIGPLAAEFRKLRGKIVTATGIVAHTSPWSGTIHVTSVRLNE